VPGFLALMIAVLAIFKAGTCFQRLSGFFANGYIDQLGIFKHGFLTLVIVSRHRCQLGDI
jgi:hypothetical protein